MISHVWCIEKFGITRYTEMHVKTYLGGSTEGNRIVHMYKLYYPPI